MHWEAKKFMWLYCSIHFVVVFWDRTVPSLSAYSCNFIASTINISKIICRYIHSNCSVYLHSNISLKLCLQSGGPT